MMLNDNASVMQERIEKSADPDVTLFNVALPKKRRLPVFEAICPATDKKKKARKTKPKMSSAKSEDELDNMLLSDLLKASQLLCF